MMLLAFVWLDLGNLLDFYHLHRSHPYEHNPSILIHHVMQHVTTMKQSDWPDPCQPFIQMLNKYKQKLDDRLQAQTLENLGLGILWMDGWTDGRTDRRTDGQTDGLVVGLDGWTDRQTDRLMDGPMHGWIDRLLYNSHLRY